MNSIILHDTSGVILDPKILNHLHETLKAKVGDKLRFTVLNQGLCFGTLTFLDEKKGLVDLGEINPGQEPWFDLVVGAARPQTTKKIFEHGATFGVRKILFFKAVKSEKSYLTSKVFETVEATESLIDGLAQSNCYYRLPQFELCSYNPAERFHNNEWNQTSKFILDLDGSENFLAYKMQNDLSFTEPCVLAIGPERGWIHEDLAPFKNAGFKSVKISSSVLRVEHAIYSAVSQLELLRSKF